MSTVLKPYSHIIDYINVLKPKETSLLVYIGACTALVAVALSQSSFPTMTFVFTVIAITLGGAGANGLTNYLDRDIDARMKRTCSRVLPSRRIDPPEKVLPVIAACILAALIIAWFLSPICFAIGLVGILASAIWRKTISCTYFGIVAGGAALLIGWFGITKQLSTDILPVLFFCLIAAWTPIHVWTLMIANRQDYEAAGLHYFPLSWKDGDVTKILVILSFLLSIISILIFVISGMFHWVYLVVCSILSLLMISASIHLLVSPTSRNSWSVYKFTAFPYLGIIFTAMVVDVWFL